MVSGPKDPRPFWRGGRARKQLPPLGLPACSVRVADSHPLCKTHFTLVSRDFLARPVPLVKVENQVTR